MLSARIKITLYFLTMTQIVPTTSTRIEITMFFTNCVNWNILTDELRNHFINCTSQNVRGLKYVIIGPWAKNKYRTQLTDIYVGQTTRVRESKYLSVSSHIWTIISHSSRVRGSKYAWRTQLQKDKSKVAPLRRCVNRSIAKNKLLKRKRNRKYGNVTL